MQRENTAKEYRIYDANTAEPAANARVFIHPSSVLFSESTWKTRFLVFFQKHMTAKVYIREVTQASKPFTSEACKTHRVS